MILQRLQRLIHMVPVSGGAPPLQLRIEACRSLGLVATSSSLKHLAIERLIKVGRLGGRHDKGRQAGWVGERLCLSPTPS